MRVLITQHYFRTDATSFPEAVVNAVAAHGIALGQVDEGFSQEVVEVDRLIEAVAYDCGLDVEDLTEVPPDDTWVETPHGIFITSPEQCLSYIILDELKAPIQLFN